MIPLEYGSFSLFLGSLVPDVVAASVGFGIGLLALVLSMNKRVGWACLLFHILVVFVCNMLVQTLGQFATILLALLAWSLAWILQVGVGHWVWEKNQPNVASPDSVSMLSVCESVLIAWSS